ncbi:MAG: pectate lyase, partial [Bacillota bacterium]|nr:pectate lyase [Bacillota bacterium]
SILNGAEWIRVANDSKAYTGSPLATFNVNSTADIFIAYDDRITTKPSWFTGWTDTGTDIKDNQSTPITYSVFKKTVMGGTTVTLGPNGNTSYCLYSVFAKPVTIMSNLTVSDTANEMDWSIRTNPVTGSLLFGDRTLTIATLPSILTGAEWIRPANDSKAYTGSTLATFKVNVNTDVYIAFDDRVTTKPSWFTGWTDTGSDVKDNQSTQVTYSVFKKTFTAGTTVTLGPTGNSSFCQYVIFSKPQGL